MSAIKRYIEDYAEQHNLTFEAAAAALAKQQTEHVPVSLDPSAVVLPLPIHSTPIEPVLTPGM